MAQDREVSTDVLAQPVNVDLIGKLGSAVTGGDLRVNSPKVDLTAEAEYAGTPVEHRLDLVDTHIGGAPQVADHPGIDIPGSSAHHQTLHRSHPHRGVDRSTASDRRRRCAIA